MPLSIKSQNDSFRFEHELKMEMHEDFEYVKSLEKEVDELESEKADFSNMYDLLLEECVSKDVICSYLHSLSELNAHTELQCMYLHKVKECEFCTKLIVQSSYSLGDSGMHKALDGRISSLLVNFCDAVLEVAFRKIYVFYERSSGKDYNWPHSFKTKRRPIMTNSDRAPKTIVVPSAESQIRHIKESPSHLEQVRWNPTIQFRQDDSATDPGNCMNFIRTEYQLADMFTKALPEDQFKYLVRRIAHSEDRCIDNRCALLAPASSTKQNALIESRAKISIKISLGQHSISIRGRRTSSGSQDVIKSTTIYHCRYCQNIPSVTNGIHKRWNSCLSSIKQALDETMILLVDEDALPHDLLDLMLKDTHHIDDDGVEGTFILVKKKIDLECRQADVARSTPDDGDGGGDDVPITRCTTGKGKRKPNLGGRGAGRLNTRDKTRNLSLKEIAEAKGLESCDVVLPSWEKGPGSERKMKRSFQRLGRTWIPPAGQRSTKASTCTCKKPTIPTRLLFKALYWMAGPIPPGNMMWGDQRCGHVTRRLQRLRGYSTLSFRMIPRSLLETLKIAKLEKVAPSYSRKGSRSLRLACEMTYGGDEKAMRHTGEYTEKNEINGVGTEGVSFTVG
ncbi:hypothetical protein Tco_0791732 [Tanacetum coccineum]